MPDNGIGHWEATEAVFDEGVVRHADVREESSQVGLGEEGHIVASRPAFADPRHKAVKVTLREEEMKEGNAGVEFDREVAVGGSEVAPPTDPVELRKKATLIIEVSDMFDDGV